MFRLDEKIEYIEKSIDTSIAIVKQDKYMSSDVINRNFNAIENTFNELYEKIRVVEDIIDCSRAYVDNEVSKTIRECKGTINEIEKMNDIVFADMKNYTVINVPFQTVQSARMVDRDGSPLSKSEIYNNTLSLSGVLKDTLKVDNVDIVSNEEAYDRNKLSLSKGHAYRSTYLLDGIASDGVQETITLAFDSVKEMNSVKIKLANCSIKYIKYIYEDGTVSIDVDFNSSASVVKSVKSIIFEICSVNYIKKMIQVNLNSNNEFDMTTPAVKGVTINERVVNYNNAINRSNLNNIINGGNNE